jgi:hypothetical protein
MGALELDDLAVLDDWRRDPAGWSRARGGA